MGRVDVPGLVARNGRDSLIQFVKKLILRLLALVLLFVTIFAVLATYTNVPTTITAEDITAFAEIGVQRETSNRTYEQEVALIRTVQAAVLRRVPNNKLGIPEYETREPADLFRVGQGQCYDRSRTLDKLLLYLGFQSRHVYMLYQEGRPFLVALFHHGQLSHAVTEVKTSKGWMLVDSNSTWISSDHYGEPVNADQVWRRFKEFDNPPSYFSYPSWAIRGLYSRKGQFYGAGIPFPEANWADLLGWLALGK